jgi:hypothetical protein
MAKVKISEVKSFNGNKKVSRPGRHSKNKSSKIKSSKNYLKKYKGQGK